MCMNFVHVMVKAEINLLLLLEHRTDCSVASFGTFVSRTLPYTAYRCTVFFLGFFFLFFFFNNSQTFLFAVAINE